MGSIPSEPVLRLKKIYNLKNFVETGTWKGQSTIWAAKHFKKVVTIEMGINLWESVSKRYRQEFKNIEFLQGSSLEHLTDILKGFSEPALIWLDAHWSKNLGYEKPEIVCPVLEELSIIRINSTSEDVILIDDAKNFGAIQGWPTLEQLTFAAGYNDRTVYTKKDVIYSLP